ncbi:hypothetical protein [Labrys monachus]|uniref:Uncharacterized protein n=1 Tax=Labrys monachus TaxID=217067 RepID=A0ABU0FF11_9HYPH|nr:hypothetical protein [Labrys monachus]MDQ0392688.1 hypothetical protein [Labrys monachus]
MDVDKAIARISAAGLELTDRRRNPEDDGWRLSFANGALVTVHDSGEVAMEGKGIEAVAQALDIPAAPGEI